MSVIFVLSVKILYCCLGLQLLFQDSRDREAAFYLLKDRIRIMWLLLVFNPYLVLSFRKACAVADCMISLKLPVFRCKEDHSNATFTRLRSRTSCQRVTIPIQDLFFGPQVVEDMLLWKLVLEVRDIPFFASSSTIISLLKVLPEHQLSPFMHGSLMGSKGMEFRLPAQSCGVGKLDASQLGKLDKGFTLFSWITLSIYIDFDYFWWELFKHCLLNGCWGM